MVKSLSKKQKQLRMKAEREQLLKDAEQLSRDSQANAKSAKEAKQLAKSTKGKERDANREEAKRLEQISAEQDRLAKEAKKDAKSLTSIAAYEKYLAKKELAGIAQAQTAPAAAAKPLAKSAPAVAAKPLEAAPYESAYDSHLEMRDAESFAEEYTGELDMVKSLSKKQKQLRMKTEREQLLKDSEQLSREARENAKNAKEAEKLAKKAKGDERAAKKAEAKLLKEKSIENQRLADEAKKNAKALNSIDAYEKYLAQKDMSAAAKAGRAVSPKSAKAAKPIPEISTAAFDKSMSKKELRAEAKRRSIELEREANRLEAEKKEADRLAKEERRLAKSANRAEKPVHTSEADAQDARSRELKEKAELAKREAKELKELKTLNDFEKYNAAKEALAAKKNLSDAKPVKAVRESEPERDFADADKYIKRDRAAIEGFCREQIARDERTLERRYDTRATKVVHDLELAEMHFGKKGKKYKKKVSELNREIELIEAHIPRAMEAERLDNERYLSVVRTDVDKLKLPKKVDRAKLTALQIEVENLLRERDQVNDELTALYNSNRSADDKFNTTYDRLRNSRKSAKNSYKKYRKLANEVEDLRVPIDEKRKIHDTMNRINQLNAEIGDIKYRLEKEKLHGRAKRAANTHLTAKRRELAVLDKRVKTLSSKAREKDGKERHELTQRLTWLTILVIVVGLGVAGYIFRDAIAEFVNGLIAQLGGIISQLGGKF